MTDWRMFLFKFFKKNINILVVAVTIFLFFTFIVINCISCGLMDVISNNYLAIAEVSSIDEVPVDIINTVKSKGSVNKPCVSYLNGFIGNQSPVENEIIIEDEQEELATNNNSEDMDEQSKPDTVNDEDMKEEGTPATPVETSTLVEESSVDFSRSDDFRIEVDLLKQKTFVFYRDELLKEMICSGGIEEKPTPLGEFATSQKGDYFWSQKYNVGAYYWIRFYNEYLFHSVPFDKNNQMIEEEYNKLGSPASHGCIRLALEDARWLYETLPLGIKVSIH